MKRVFAVIAVMLLVTAGTAGEFVRQEIRKVPVERLAANIGRQLEANPASIELRLNLARLYAMAYALKVSQFEATGKEETLEPWFGYTPRGIPGPVRGAGSREAAERARADLDRALQAYRDVIARAPQNAMAHLGYAWTLEQCGRGSDAVGAYRKVVELAYPAETKQGSFVAPMTVEAARRLEALLDPVRDAAELDSLSKKVAELEKQPRMITPIAISLGGVNAGPPADPAARVRFDADGSGVAREWTWITPDAGWLVYDVDGRGEITSALQWFGNVTFWLFWPNGYEPLRALDDDGDGEIRGPELRHLAVWRDVNQNGASERGEVRPLSAHGIVALSCGYDVPDDPWVAAYSPSGVTFADGSTRPTYDVILRRAVTGGQP